MTTVFAFADLTMALVAITNLVAVALLLKVALRVIRDYDSQSRAGRTPAFNPDDFKDLNIDRDAWTDAGEDGVLTWVGLSNPSGCRALSIGKIICLPRRMAWRCARSGGLGDHGWDTRLREHDG